MRDLFIKILAYTILIVGVIIALLLIGGAIFVFYILLPEAVLWKKTMIIIGGVISAIVVLFISVGIFEYLKAFLKIEEEIEEISEEK